LDRSFRRIATINPTLLLVVALLAYNQASPFVTDGGDVGVEQAQL
jgi:hypothetical protein